MESSRWERSEREAYYALLEKVLAQIRPDARPATPVVPIVVPRGSRRHRARSVPRYTQADWFERTTSETQDA